MRSGGAPASAAVPNGSTLSHPGRNCRALRPGRPAGCLKNVMQCIAVCVGAEDELVNELCMEQLFRAEDEDVSPGESGPSGIEVILAALFSVNDHSFHVTACKALYHAASEGDEISEWLETGLVVLTSVLNYACDGDDAAATESAEAVGLVFLTILQSKDLEVKKKVSRYITTNSLDTMSKILGRDEASPGVLRVFLALVGKIAILPDIKEAMMHAGLLETTIKLMTVHHADVDVQEHGARSGTPIWDTGCCCHPLTGVPYLRPGPRAGCRTFRTKRWRSGAPGPKSTSAVSCGGRRESAGWPSWESATTAGAVGGCGSATVAVGETVILLHPPLPLVGVSTGMERGCQ